VLHAAAGTARKRARPRTTNLTTGEADMKTTVVALTLTAATLNLAQTAIAVDPAAGANAAVGFQRAFGPHVGSPEPIAVSFQRAFALREPIRAAGEPGETMAANLAMGGNIDIG